MSKQSPFTAASLIVRVGDTGVITIHIIMHQTDVTTSELRRVEEVKNRGNGDCKQGRKRPKRANFRKRAQCGGRFSGIRRDLKTFYRLRERWVGKDRAY